MSYEKMMKWNRKHVKGISYKKGWMGFDSGYGKFTPAIAWLEGDWWPYLEKCKQEGIEPMECEAYYKSNLRRV